MKAKFTLEKTESQSIRQMLEDIPIDLCGYVNCPKEIEGNCDACPLLAISNSWSKGLEQLCQQTSDALKKIEG
jgi:hypothetical protein